MIHLRKRRAAQSVPAGRRSGHQCCHWTRHAMRPRHGTGWNAPGDESEPHRPADEGEEPPMATIKFFFLVAGFDYEHGGSKRGLEFNHMCTGRVRERIVFINDRVGKPDALITQDTTLRFLRFDVETGKIEVIDRAFVAGRGVKRTTVLEQDWKPLSSVGTGDAFDPAVFVTKRPLRAVNAASDYQPGGGNQPGLKQDATTTDIMSIVDVYHSVHDAPDGSVLEVSFFAHGWVEGPILVNSSDLRPAEEVRNHPHLRDTTDKDGRASVDFNITMGEPIDGTVTSMT